MVHDRQRRSRFALLPLVVLLVLAGLAPGVASAAEPDVSVDPETVLVRLDSGPLTRLMRRGSPWVAMPVRDGETAEDALQRLEADPVVAEASFNYYYEPLDVDPPNDPDYPLQWHLPEVGVLGAWEYTRGWGATIAIVDTGVSDGGDDLDGCRIFLWPYNAATETEGSAEPDADDGHGTHVAGTAVQCTDNANDTAGVAPDADLIPIRVSPAAPDPISTEDVANGIYWAVDHGAHVINISLGRNDGCSTPWPDCGDPVLDDAIAHAASSNVAVVAAAGNASGAHVFYPANHPDTIAVGASTSSRKVAEDSAQGPALDLVAPGEAIYQEKMPNNGVWGVYAQSGTSSAAPHVTGAVALLRSLDSSLTPGEILDLLTDTALDIGEPGRDDVSGAGLLQIDAAIEALLAPAESDSSVIGGTGAVAASVATQIAQTTGSAPTRLWGTSRFSTASSVSMAVGVPREPVVYVATGLNFPDALAVGPVAALQDAPILLVNTTSIPGPTLTEVGRLDPHRIVVVGGSGAVSDGVVSQLEQATNAVVERIDGPNRYSTAVGVSKSYFRNTPRVDTVYLTTGQNFPDALSAGPAATEVKGPVLLTLPNALPGAVANELVRLDPKRVVIVGGTGAVGANVGNGVRDLLGFSPDRLAGSNRYETSAQVVGDAFRDAPIPTYIATGENFPDALAAGAAIGSRDGALLLTRPTSLPGVIAAELQRLSS